MNILMVLTSHDKLGNTGKPTGFWLEEFAAPWYVFRDADAHVTLASPAGGHPPLDPVSDEPDARTANTERFRNDSESRLALANTLPLREVRAHDFDALFFPGGHGPMWDLAQSDEVGALIDDFWAAGKPVGAVCHAPAILRMAKKTDGTPLVAGKRVTGFSNSEEAAVGLSDIVPFRVEDELKAQGGLYESTDDWGVLVITDGHLVTGQNPASSAGAAQDLLKLLGD